MSFFEQNRPLDFSKAVFDAEYALRFSSITNHREIFTAWNVPANDLAELIECAKDLIPNQFIIEYHSIYTKNPLYLGPNGLMLSAYRFNTKYSKSIKKDATYNINVSKETINLIKNFVAKTSTSNRFFIQSCLIREFSPNQSISHVEKKRIYEKDSQTDISHEIQTAVPLELTPSVCYNIITELKNKFDFISFNNGMFRFSNHYLSDDFYKYWIEFEFEFEDKIYSNWLFAFLDVCAEAEKRVTYVRLPINSNENSIFRDGEYWKPYKVCLNELLEVIELNKQLETKISNLKIECLNATGQDKAKLNIELDELLSELVIARRKRIDLNNRNMRQINILYKNYMSHYLKLKNKVDDEVDDEVELLILKFNYLHNLRKGLLKKINENQNKVKYSYELHQAKVCTYNVFGMQTMKGKFEFSMNASFINILFSKNIQLLEGITELVFTLSDGKTIFHFPSYIEESAKSHSISIKFDEVVGNLLLQFYQRPQDLIAQACFNQGEHVLANYLESSEKNGE